MAGPAAAFVVPTGPDESTALDESVAFGRFGRKFCIDGSSSLVAGDFVDFVTGFASKGTSSRRTLDGIGNSLGSGTDFSSVGTGSDTAGGAAVTVFTGDMTGIAAGGSVVTAFAAFAGVTEVESATPERAGSAATGATVAAGTTGAVCRIAGTADVGEAKVALGFSDCCPAVACEGMGGTLNGMTGGGRVSGARAVPACRSIAFGKLRATGTGFAGFLATDFFATAFAISFFLPCLTERTGDFFFVTWARLGFTTLFLAFGAFFTCALA